MAEKLTIDVLAPAPRNPRKIKEAALEGLGTSMKEFGDISGIVLNERSGHLVAGHQRVKTLRAAGVTEWVRTSKTTGEIRHPVTGERFGVRIVDWDETTEMLANITANNPAIAGEFTVEALSELRALEEQANFEALKLDELRNKLAEELDAITRGGAGTPEGNTAGDEAVEPPAEPFTRPGDLWVLGQHRLLCGDSTNPADVARVLGGRKARLLATDPPYGVDYVAIKSSIPGMEAIGRFDDIANDDLKDENLGDFLDKMFAAAMPHLAEGVAIYIWHPSGELNHVFRTSMLRAGILVHRQIIWVKPQFVMTRSGMYHWQHEPCFYGWRQGDVPPWYGEKNQSSVWQVGRDDGKAVHPTQKPIALFETPMLNHTVPGDTCLELFSGSGSQIIAGERTERRVCAIEMSPRYVDAAVIRWMRFTGKTAYREDGVPFEVPDEDAEEPSA